MTARAPRAALDLSAIEESALDALTKSYPATRPPTRLADAGALGLNVLREDLCFPVLVLKESALDENRRFMRAFLAHTGAMLAPHGKTTMAPQLFDAQLEDGAWAITVATVPQLQVCRRFGVPRVVLANQIVGSAALEVVMDALARDPAFEIVTLVDSVDGARRLADAARARALTRPVQLLVELGLEGGRTGCRTHEQAMAVARAVAADRALALVGVEGFEGLIHTHDAVADAARVSAYLDALVGLARACAAEGLFRGERVLLSAGGSAYYDLVSARLGASGIPGASVLLRSGCYLTHDDGVYAGAIAAMRARTPSLAALPAAPRAALELWALVQSRPEPELAILTVGKRDVGNDLGLPTPLSWSRPGSGRAPLPPGHALVDLNDQHAYLRVPKDSALDVGDRVCLGISHPCTTFDKWPVLWVVDDAYDVTRAIRTYF